MRRRKIIEEPVTRRGLILPAILALLMALAVVHEARARDIVDAKGRTVTIPDAPARVFAAGPPASVLLYAVAPEAMVGWVRAPRDSDLPYLLPATHGLPELGRLAGRGGDVTLEVLLATQPDLIVNFGTVNSSYIDLANSITDQTGIPYILIDGSFENTPAALRMMGEAMGVPARGEALAAYAEETLARVDAVLAEVAPQARPQVYLARGSEGLETPARGSVNAEIVERVGATNVALGETRGLITPSLEQVIAWAPDTILTIDRDFAASVRENADWQAVPAVAEGRVLLAPSAPFGWIDSPPSINRLIGLRWLSHSFYPDQTQGDLRAEVRDFHRLFWQVEPDEAMLDRLLGN